MDLLNKTDKGGVKGLPNGGNTCYINTVIQCIFSCELFSDYMKKCTTNDNKSLILENINEIMLSTTYKTTLKNYEQLVKILQRKIPSIDINEHNDIHEFTLLLFNVINEEICIYLSDTNILVDTKSTENITNNLSNLYKKCNINWVDSIKKEYSEFSMFFTGQWINQLICGHCNKIHHNYEIFKDIELEIIGENIFDCLNYYFRNYYINDWICNKCNEASKSFKSLKLFRLPQIMLIYLKRFKYDGNKFVKNNKYIAIPEVLDMRKYILKNHYTGEHIYNLRAVGCHSGMLLGGHYTSYCKQIDTNKLHLADDMKVSTPLKIDYSDAYVLYYEISLKK